MSETMLAVGIAATILAGMFAWALLLEVVFPLLGRVARRPGAGRRFLMGEADAVGASRLSAKRPEEPAELRY